MFKIITFHAQNDQVTKHVKSTDIEFPWSDPLKVNIYQICLLTCKCSYLLPYRTAFFIQTETSFNTGGKAEKYNDC